MLPRPCRSVAVWALAAITLGVAPACREGPEASRSEEEARAVDAGGSRVEIALAAEPAHLDPHLQDEFVSYTVVSQSFETLVDFDADMQIRPRLASAWENPDDLSWRFTLRSGVRFHDGRPLTSRDVVFSLRRAIEHPESAVSSYLVAVEDVEAIDEGTVLVRTREPYPILLNKLAFIFILPAGTSDGLEAAGTGPWARVGLARDRVVLQAFTDYWGRRPVYDQAVLHFLPDEAQRWDGLLSGELDLVAEPSPDRIEGAPDWVRFSHREALSVAYLHLRFDFPPFADRRVRQAIHLALDRERLVEEMASGMGRPVGQMVGRHVFGHTPGLEAPRPDPERARELLAEAGWADGFDITLQFREGRDGSAIAEQLAAIGLRVELQASPWAELYSDLQAGRVPFYFGRWGSASGDASDLFDHEVHTRDLERGYGDTNAAGYSNPQLDRLIEASGTRLDMVDRQRLLGEAMTRLMEDLPLVPLYETERIFASRGGVEWAPRLDGRILAAEIARP